MTTPPRSRESLTLVNDETELRRLSTWLRRFTQAARWPESQAADVELCVNEIVADIIDHAYDDARPREIQISLEHSDEKLYATVEDDGRPFHPLEAPAVETARTLADARIRGWGIPIVKALAGEIGYEHVGGRNRLTLVWRRKTTI